MVAVVPRPGHHALHPPVGFFSFLVLFPMTFCKSEGLCCSQNLVTTPRHWDARATSKHRFLSKINLTSSLHLPVGGEMVLFQFLGTPPHSVGSSGITRLLGDRNRKEAWAAIPEHRPHLQGL